MYGWVSMALRRHILRNFDVDAEIIDRALKDTLAEVIADHARFAALGQAGNAKLRKALQEGAVRDPQVLVTLLRAGELELFELGFGKLTGLKLSATRHALYEPGGRALARICKACGLSREIYAAIYVLARRAGSDPRQHAADDLRTALAYFDGWSPPAKRPESGAEARGDRRKIGSPAPNVACTGGTTGK